MIPQFLTAYVKLSGERGIIMSAGKVLRKITKTNYIGSFKGTVYITYDFLKKHNIKGLILDVDNTLALHDDPEPADGIAEWAKNMRRHGIKLLILSNNDEKRVKPFAQKLGMDYVCDVTKPGSKGYKLAQEKLGLPKENIAGVGDQVFTDMWGANNYGISMIFVKALHKESWKKQPHIRLKRILEAPFRPKKYRK